MKTIKALQKALDKAYDARCLARDEFEKADEALHNADEAWGKVYDALQEAKYKTIKK